MRADVVYLVKYTGKDDDVAGEFYAKIDEELNQKYEHIQKKNVFLDLWDLYECMEKFRKIIRDAGENHVYVNVSTGSKITSIAGMLACMMWNAHPYYAPVSYVRKAKIINESEKVGEPEGLPTYSINKPKQEFMLILDLLNKNGGVMRKSRLINELEKKRVIKTSGTAGNELSGPAKHSILRTLLDPMIRDWNLVSVKASGRRSEVSINQTGETALKIFGTES